MNTRKNSKKRDNSGDILLFSTETGVIAVDSSIRKQIIGLIEERDISFDEIVSQTAKAKSTISEHIKDLEQNDLITSRTDPQDFRKKILSLSAQFVGRLTNDDRVSATSKAALQVNTIPFTHGDIPSFFQFMFSSIRIEAMKRGINTDPILRQAGYQVGLAIKPLVSGVTLAEKITSLDQVWRMYGLGEITLLNETPITLKVQGCFECVDLPITGHVTCSFDSGVFSAFFADEFIGVARVHEIECYSSGYDHCIFIIYDPSS